MGDLVKRLRDINTNYELARGIHCDISEAAARIEALEARIAKADALAATLIYIRDGEKLNTVHMRRAAAVSLAAYREGSE